MSRANLKVNTDLDAFVPEDLDKYERIIETAREARIKLIDVLDKAAKEGDISREEAVRTFAKAYLMPTNVASQYMATFNPNFEGV
jgi:NADH:ubiquinone oxidoreductase subunit E